MTADTYERRLEKIEDKIDKLSEAVVSIARIEERVTTVLKQNDRFFDRIERLENRVDLVETHAAASQKTVAFAERFMWVTIAAAVGAGAYFVRI